jgi:stage II sporulation protein D
VIRALIGEYQRLSVDVTGPFRVESGGLVLTRGASAGSATVRAEGRSLEVGVDPGGGVASAPDVVAIVPERGGEVRVDGVGYGGRIVVRVGLSGRLQAINVLPLEEYLEGVVPHEIGNPGPDAYAAMEAQAITARTYALSRIEERKAEPFDVFAGVQDQVYRGRSRLSRTASAAVRDTRGVVLTYRGRLARTYYSATCGGHTSDIRRVWPQRESADYLLGAYDHAGRGSDSFCSGVRNFRWRYAFSGRELGELLRRTLPAELQIAAGSVGSFVDLRVAERSPSGRVRKLEIETSSGTFTVEGDRIRWVLMLDADRGRILPSTLFDVERTVRAGRVVRVSIVGGGNGHGVGMCQNGAIGMARRGYSHQMILSHYYPGTTLAPRY